MKYTLTVLLTCFGLLAYSQNGGNTTYNILDIDSILNARLIAKYGGRAAWPWRGAGYPTRNSSYSYSNFIIVNGRLNLDGNVTNQPIPESIQIFQYTAPGNSRVPVRVTQNIQAREIIGKTIAFSKYITGSFTEIEGTIDSNNDSFEATIKNYSTTTGNTSSSSVVTERINETTLDFTIPRNKELTVTARYEQSIGWQQFEGVLVIDCRVVNTHIMALSSGDWVGPVSGSGMLSEKLTLEERTIKVSGRLGNISTSDWVIGAPIITNLPRSNE